MWKKATIWEMYIYTFTRLMVTKLIRVLTSGKRFSTQTLKLSPTSYYWCNLLKEEEETESFKLLLLIHKKKMLSKKMLFRNSKFLCLLALAQYVLSGRDQVLPRRFFVLPGPQFWFVRILADIFYVEMKFQGLKNHFHPNFRICEKWYYQAKH